MFRRRFAKSSLSAADAQRASRTLLEDGLMSGVLVDADSRNGHPEVIALGAGAFVNDDFIRCERTDPRPGLTERVLQSVVTRHRIVLTAREIANGNRGEGLTQVVVLHDTIDGLALELNDEVRHHLTTAFLRDMAGYRLIDVLTECWADEVPWATAGGFRVRSDYSSAYSTAPDLGRQRCLMGVRREEAPPACLSGNRASSHRRA